MLLILIFFNNYFIEGGLQSRVCGEDTGRLGRSAPFLLHTSILTPQSFCFLSLSAIQIEKELKKFESQKTGFGEKPGKFSNFSEFLPGDTF